MKVILQVVIGLGLLAVPALSAEKLSFQHGEFERSIPIDELADYAASGSPGSALSDVLCLFKPSEKYSLRKAFNQSAPVNAVMASNYLSTAASLLNGSIFRVARRKIRCGAKELKNIASPAATGIGGDHSS